MIRALFRRIHLDYFLKDRIESYDELIGIALQKGFSILSHSQFYELVKNNAWGNKKILMIRQDVDSDPLYCLKWLEIEKKYGIHTSYYFRKETIDVHVMKAIMEYGSDCGYHYEELATFAKKHKIKDQEKIKASFGQIRSEFKKNLAEIEHSLGSKLRFASSHGDFANRKLNIPNHAFIDHEFLAENGLQFEAYDDVFVKNYSINIMDSGGPRFYCGEISQLEALDRFPIVHLLMHPKNWRSNIYWNTKQNLKRLVEGLMF